MRGWIIDLLFVIIALVTVVIYTKRGFVQSIFKHGRNIAAVILTFVFGPVLSDFLYNKFIYNGVYTWVLSKLGNLVDSTAEKIDIDALMENLPYLVRQFLTPETVKEKFGQAIQELGNNTEAFSAVVSEPLAGALSNFLSYVIVFLLATIVLLLLGFLFDLFTRLPIIHGLNVFLGFVVGVVVAFLLLAVATYAISLAVSVWGSAEALDELISKSVLLGLFDKIQLFDLH